VSTAGRIPDGDESAWYTEWRALAERVHADADTSATEGHFVSAREAYLRASNYYQLSMSTAGRPRRTTRSLRSGSLSVSTFASAARLMNRTPQSVRIPYEDTTLPGWWSPADPGTAHPLAATRTVPGRPCCSTWLRQHRRGAVLHRGAAAPDVAITCSPSRAPDKAAPFVTSGCSSDRTGTSSSPRLSTGSWPGQTWTPTGSRSWDELGRTSRTARCRRRAPPGRPDRLRRHLLLRRRVYYAVGPEVMQLVHDGDDEKVDTLIEQLMSSSTRSGRSYGGALGLWSRQPRCRHPRHRPYTIEGYAQLITCPTLVLEARSTSPSTPWLGIKAL